MEYVVGLAIGCIISIIFNLAYWRAPTFGCLEVDETDPEDVKMRLVIDKELDFSKHKRVLLKVDNKTRSRK